MTAPKPTVPQPLHGEVCAVNAAGVLTMQAIVLGCMAATSLLAGSSSNLLLAVQAFFFLGLVTIPVVAVGVARSVSLHISLAVAMLFYGLNFGVRALYFIVAPDVVLYPSVSPADDLHFLVTGLAWCGAGVVGLTAGYLLARRREAIRGDATFEFLTRSLGPLSAPGWLALLYVVGLAARLRMIQTGSAFWYYNSPSFDLAFDRADPYMSGAISLASGFCLLAWAAALVNYIRKPKRERARWYRALVITGFVGEVFFCVYTLNKFAIIGLLLVTLITTAHIAKTRWKTFLAGCAVVVVVVIPFFNSAREKLLPYYYGLAPSYEKWSMLAGDARLDATAAAKEGWLRAVADPFFGRLNGAEALVAATKVGAYDAMTPGATYFNIVALVQPGLLRPRGWQPAYVEWPTLYVGLDPQNFTVIPVPAVVEAYLNFGWYGPPIALLAIGAMLACLDRLGAKVASSLGIALIAYSSMRLLNIENYLFLNLVPVMKLWMVAAVWAGIMSIAGSKSKRETEADTAEAETETARPEPIMSERAPVTAHADFADVAEVTGTPPARGKSPDARWTYGSKPW